MWHKTRENLHKVIDKVVEEGVPCKKVRLVIHLIMKMQKEEKEIILSEECPLDIFNLTLPLASDVCTIPS